MRTLIAFFILAASQAFGAAAYVSSTSASGCGSGSTLVASQACSLAVTAGNQLFVVVGSQNFATVVTPFTISDGGVNTYTLLTTSNSNTKMAVWLVSSLATTATITVTVTPAASQTLSIAMEQVSGASGTVDVQQFQDKSITGSGGTYTCSAFTSLTANAYIFGAGLQGQSNGNTTTMAMTVLAVNDTQGAGGQTGVGNRLAFGHQLTTTTTSVTPVFTCSVNCVSSTASCFVASIKAAGAATPILHRVIVGDLLDWLNPIRHKPFSGRLLDWTRSPALVRIDEVEAGL